MEGLVFYADLFASWVENLSGLWSFLNSNMFTMIQHSIDIGTNNPDAYLASAFFKGLQGLILAFGFEDLTILGFMFSIMGMGFGLYFCIMLIRWFVDILPL